MRPLRLSVKGFTAFRDEVELDLSDLDLFAITGPTGAGKSSLLDAITYALYGRADRVGRQVAQLVSQGQPQMAVVLEFAVGDRRYRVARRTPANGASRAKLERLEGGAWRDEPADGVREVDDAIERIVGLDYEAFTRSVLLPQGKFQGFLVGDAKERRRILSELLGLELFERLGKRAGELRRAAEADVRAKRSVLETEYAGASEEAVARAEEALREAEAREERLRAVRERVAGLLDRWRGIEASVGSLASCAEEAREVAAHVRRREEELGAVAGRLSEAAEAAEARRAEAEAAREEAARAERELWDAERRWGKAPAVAALAAKAEGLERLRAGVEEAEEELRGATERRPALEADREAAAAELERCEAALEEERRALAEAEEELERTRHANLAAAVRERVRVGEPCPVCGVLVERLPRGGRPPDLERAQRAAQRAKRAAEEAERARAEADRAAREAEAALRGNDEDVARCERDLRRRREELEAVRAELRAALGGRLPRDPARALRERRERLEELARAVERAREMAAAAERARSEAERHLTEVRGEVDAARAAIEHLPVGGLVERAVAAAGGALPRPELPSLAALPEEPGALAETARALAKGLETFAADLSRLADERRGAERELLAEVREAVEGLLAVPGTLRELAEALDAARGRQAAEVGELRAALDHERGRLAAAARLAEEVGALERRAGVLEALAKELRQDRLIAFLQREALLVLADAATERLAELSEGRYRLAYLGDEFSVIDTWNGEEARSARTLSGGETFLASLALALALSERVASLSVTERARLDSLFLDEGFGTLDPESLETVVEAIERLGSDGKLVGVITHVPELAIRLPVRFEVVKSPRGSRVEVVRG